jgi:hypothetical protein
VAAVDNSWRRVGFIVEPPLIALQRPGPRRCRRASTRGLFSFVAEAAIERNLFYTTNTI